MYAKLKPNGQIQIAPKVLRIVVSNPSDERLEYEGYKKVEESTPPEYNPETQHIESHYIDDGDCIRQVLDVVDDPVEQMEDQTM